MQGAGRLGELLRNARRGAGPPLEVPPPVIARPGRSVFAVHDGNVTIAAQRAGADPDSDECIARQVVHNRVTSVGRAALGDMLLNIGVAPGFVAVGTGTKAAEDADTGLQIEVYRAALSRRYRFTGLVRLKLFLSVSDANGNLLTEAGLFVGTSYNTSGSPSLGGQCFARATFAPYFKDGTTQLTITWDLPITSG